MNKKTIRYYDLNAETYVEDTELADMRECRDRFLAYLKPGQIILDAGCGSGRDILAFQQKGFVVEAFDASEQMCKIASRKTGIYIKQQCFEELEGEAIYDGIWACASLLHVKRSDLPDTINRLHKLLKPGGVLYASFKYGNREYFAGERYFNDMSEDECKSFFERSRFEIKELYVSNDVRNYKINEKWINMIARSHI